MDVFGGLGREVNGVRWLFGGLCALGLLFGCGSSDGGSADGAAVSLPAGVCFRVTPDAEALAAGALKADLKKCGYQTSYGTTMSPPHLSSSVIGRSDAADAAAQALQKLVVSLGYAAQTVEPSSFDGNSATPTVLIEYQSHASVTASTREWVCDDDYHGTITSFEADSAAAASNGVSEKGVHGSLHAVCPALLPPAAGTVSIEGSF